MWTRQSKVIFGNRGKVVRASIIVRVLRMATASTGMDLTIRVLQGTATDVSIPPATFVKAIRLVC